MANPYGYSSLCVSIEDKEKLGKCRELLLRDAPHLRSVKITDAVLFHYLVKYFLN